MKRPLETPLLMLATALSATACVGNYVVPEAAVHRESRVVPLPSQPPEVIEIHLHRGHVLIQDGEQLWCEMEVAVQAPSLDIAMLQAASIKLDDDSPPGTWRLRTNHAIDADLDAVDISYRLQVPESIELRVIAHDARIAVRGFRGRADIRIDAGSIHARPAAGSYTLAAGSGSIRLEGWFERANLDTETGEIEVSLPPTRSPIALRATTDSGPLLIEMCQNCRLDLYYTTATGELRSSDFPVRWTSRTTRSDGDSVYRGIVGHEDSPNLVETRVHSREGVFKVRQRPGGILGPTPSRPGGSGGP